MTFDFPQFGETCWVSRQVDARDYTSSAAAARGLWSDLHAVSVAALPMHDAAKREALRARACRPTFAILRARALAAALGAVNSLLVIQWLVALSTFARRRAQAPED